MSYILDALKRADAERERGAAPGLHTRHQVTAGGPGTANAKRNISVALAAGLVLVMLALFVWVVRAPDTPAAAPSAPSAPPALAAPNMPAPEMATTPPAASTPMAAAPVVLAEAPKVQALPPPVAPTTKPTATPSASAVKPASQAAAPAPAPTPKPAPAAVPLLAELPQDLRGQIPKITITGSVYSDSPAQRLLLINNLVLPQGSVVGSELTLEEIQPRSSVFVFKGTRFRVMH